MSAAAPFRPVVVAPTFNNAGTLADVLDGLERLGLPVLVVNDGATDATAAILTERAASRPVDRFRVLTHPRNRGKAAAMQTGFAAAAEAGFTHAVTIDTDGQLDPADVPRLLERAGDNRRALVLGVRTNEPPGASARGRVGRRFSKTMIAVQTGLTLTDSQCGLRVYPLEMLRSVVCRAHRYGFETEIITLALWAGFDVVPVPVTCRYFAPDKHVSHFRPWVDTFFIVLLHFRLTLTRAFFHDHSGIGRPAKPESEGSAGRSPPGRPPVRWQ